MKRYGILQKIIILFCVFAGSLSFLFPAQNSQQEKDESTEDLPAYIIRLNEITEEKRHIAESKNEFSIASNEENKEIGKDYLAELETGNKSPEIYKIIIISFFIICCFIIAIIIITLKRTFTHEQLQQEQYIHVFKMVAANNASNKELDLTKSNNRELKRLAISCEELGNKIDAITNRKNNSKHVSDIVYKLSLELGVEGETAIVYYCAAMIYDAGFLGINPDVLNSTSLTAEEKEAMKIHVSLAKKYLKFVPKKYTGIFEDAATKHHENMDGSGYPRGLEGGEIPQIARLIRVAESYVSLSTKRFYKAAVGKKVAIVKLKENPEKYDAIVVEALEKLVLDSN